MIYDFDTPVERHGTDSLKFDCAKSRGRSPDLMPLWVADMDFPAPQPVIEALRQRVNHGIFGYTEPGEGYYRALSTWMNSRHGMQVDPDSVVVTPGVVFALATAVHALTEPGEGVLVQPPVYYPFSQVVRRTGRNLIEAPLVEQERSYSIDFEAFENALVSGKVKLFLLCNPHNPVGRAWSFDELQRIGSACARHGVTVVSDEIHMDFARPGFNHASFACLPPFFADNAILCTSASKTFNLAGLQVANIIISNAELRKRFCGAVEHSGYSQPNALGLVATQAAYEHGGEWLAQLKDYLEGNWACVEQALAPHADVLRLTKAQSTYLAWVDCRNLQMDSRQLASFVEDEAGLWLDAGHLFGKQGEGFIRINIATRRAYLQKALGQLTDAVARRS